MKSHQEIIREGKCPKCGNAAAVGTMGNVFMPGIARENVLWCKACNLIVAPEHSKFMATMHTEDHLMCPGCEREESDDPEPVIDEADFRDE